MANPSLVVRVAANLAELKANLVEGRNQIEMTTAGMQKLAAGLSGDKLIQHAHNIVAAVHEIGGVTKLTESEQARLNATLERALEKYRVLGKEAPASMVALAEATRKTVPPIEQTTQQTNLLGTVMGRLGPMVIGAFSIGSVIAFSRELLRMGDEIERLKAQLHLSGEEVQRLGFISSQTSVPIESITSALQDLQRRLGAGDTGTVGALGDLHINLARFKELNTYEQFMMLGVALQGIQSDTRRSALEAELFGKNWKAIVPALAQDLQALADKAPVMSEATSRALDELDDSIDATKLRFKVFVAEWVMAMKELNESGSSWWPKLLVWWDTVRGKAEELPKVGAAVLALAPPIEALTISLDNQRKAEDELTRTARAHIQAVEALRDQLSGAKLQEDVSLLAEAFASLTPVQRENADVLQRIADRAAELVNRGAELDPTLFALALSSEKLAGTLSLKLLPVLKELPGRVYDIRREFEQFEQATRAIANLNAMVEKNQAEVLKLQGVQTSQYDTRRAELEAQQAAEIAGAQAQANAAGNTTDAVNQMNQAIGLIQVKYATLFTDLANGWSETARITDGATGAVTRYAGATSGAIAAAGAMLDAAYRAAGIFVQDPTMLRPPGMAAGGIVTRPTLAMVGEAGPEAIIPLSRGGSAGVGGGLVVHNHIDARGATFQSRAAMDELGKRAADAIVQRLRAQGQRL